MSGRRSSTDLRTCTIHSKSPTFSFSHTAHHNPPPAVAGEGVSPQPYISGPTPTPSMPLHCARSTCSNAPSVHNGHTHTQQASYSPSPIGQGPPAHVLAGLGGSPSMRSVGYTGAGSAGFSGVTPAGYSTGGAAGGMSQGYFGGAGGMNLGLNRAPSMHSHAPSDALLGSALASGAFSRSALPQHSGAYGLQPGAGESMGGAAI